MSIEIEHLTHTYFAGEAHNALEDVCLSIREGELIGLLGHTGSGKTTLVQHLNGLLKPTSGKILVDGLDLSDKTTKLNDIRKKIGLVFQYPEYQLFEESVAKDVAFGPKNLGITGDELDKRVRDAIAMVGLKYDEVAERSPFELSGGQMRRVAIAGVLAMKPTYLVLDEPTAGLDPAGRKSILALVASLHQSGLTVLMVSHSMDDIASLATQLIVLYRGKVVACDEPHMIFSQVQKMKEWGLDVPQAAQLAQLLRERGLSLPEHLYTLDEIKSAILKISGRGKASC